MGSDKPSRVVIDFVSSSERKEAAQRWQALEQEINNTGLTNSWKWIETWLKEYGDMRHKFAFGLRDGQTIGAALVTLPLKRLKHIIPLPSLHLGTNGEAPEESICVEYNRLLVAPENLSAFALGLMSGIQQLRWSELVLHGFVPEHAQALINASNELGLSFFEQEKRVCPTFRFSMATDAPDIISALAYNKKRIRKTIDKIKAQCNLSTEWAETREQAQGILAELIELHVRRWESIQASGAFQSERVKQYHKELINVFFPETVSAFRVKLGEQTMGCLFSLVEGKHIMGYKSGINFSPEMKNFTPGLITHILCMEECKRRGYNEYDFLGGEAEYKKQLSNAENSLIWARARRGLVMNAVEMMKRVREVMHKDQSK